MKESFDQPKSDKKITKKEGPKKKIIILPSELSPYEKIREDNISEKVALLKELGFCAEEKDTKPVKRKVKLPRFTVVRRSERLSKL